MKPYPLYPKSTQFALPEVPRWLTDDGIEVVDHGVHPWRKPERRYSASYDRDGSTIHFGATREAAAQAAREAKS